MAPQDLEWWYINLPERPDRRAHAEEQFRLAGIGNVLRFEARRPDDWNGPPEKVHRMMHRTPGAIGCYHSQSTLIAYAGTSGKYVVVCEDDATFCHDLQARLEYICGWLRRSGVDWDLFWLGGTFHNPSEWCHRSDCKVWGPMIGRDVEPTDDPRILRTYGIWSTYAYIVNPANALRVHHLFYQEMQASDGIDHLCIILGPRLNCYCFVPGCVKQYDNQSNIGNGITRFSGFAKLGPHWYQDRMDQFDPTNHEWR